MKARTIGYWAATGLAALVFLSGGIFDLMRSPQVVEGMRTLGYPAYFALILGAWKVLGAAAIVAPKFPRLKEWAYAGIFFDLTGASFSHLSSGDAASKVITPLVILAIVAVSWRLRPASRVLGSLAQDSSRTSAAKVAIA